MLTLKQGRSLACLPAECFGGLEMYSLVKIQGVPDSKVPAG